MYGGVEIHSETLEIPYHSHKTEDSNRMFVTEDFRGDSGKFTDNILKSSTPHSFCTIRIYPRLITFALY
jgi:hypothetical protein